MSDLPPSAPPSESWLDYLHAALNDLAEAGSLAGAAQLTLGRVVAALGARFGRLALHDGGDGAPVVVAALGDVPPAPPHIPAQPGWQADSALLPLRAGAAPVGLIELGLASDRPIGPAERMLAEMLASAGAQALARHQADERFRALLGNAPVGLVVTDAAGTIEQANLTAAWMLGRPQAALAGTPIQAALPQIDTIAIAPPQPPIRWDEIAARRADGGSILLAAHRRPIGPPGDTRSLTALVDLSERQRIEQTSHELDRKLSTLIDLLPVGVSILNAERQVVYSNPALTQIMHLSHQGLADAAYSTFRFTRPDGSTFPDDALPTARVLAGEPAVRDVEVGIDRGDSDITWVSVSAASVSFPDWRIVALTYDITRRKRAELAAQEQIGRLELLAEAALDFAEVGLDQDRALSLIARRVAEHLGDTSAVLLRSDDRQWLDPVATDHRDPQAAALLRGCLLATPIHIGEGIAGAVVESGRAAFLPVEPEQIMRAKIHPAYEPYFERYGICGKVVVPLRARGVVIGALSVTRDRGGRPYTPADRYFLQALADRAALAIDNARLFAQVRHELAERERAQLALAAQAAELQRSNAELEQFAYIASHDLQEPLRMVASYTELLGERYAGKLDARADKYIGYAVDGARRMQQLVNDLLAYSRVGSQGRPPQPTDAAQVLERVLRGMQTTIVESGAQISIGSLPTLPADATQLGQLFQNLIANAIKFHSERPPAIQISAATHPEGWLFRVADNGIGIEPQYAERIFQIFQRLHARDTYPGSGIGLAIARRIVERHGGRIWFEPTAGGGTTFCFTMTGDEALSPSPAA